MNFRHLLSCDTIGWISHNFVIFSSAFFYFCVAIKGNQYFQLNTSEVRKLGHFT